MGTHKTTRHGGVCKRKSGHAGFSKAHERTLYDNWRKNL